MTYTIGAAAHIGSTPGLLRQDLICICVVLGSRSHWGLRE